jgi:formylglycine-generating enzyme required for sulfatase activity
MRVSAAPLVAALALLLFVEGSVLAQDRPIVAVFEVEAKRVGLPADALEGMADYLGTLMARRGYQVVPRSQLKERLSAQKKDSYKQCFDESCQIEIGKELAADKSLATQILKLGKSCKVNLGLFDLRKAASERAGTASGPCDEENVVKSLEAAVEDLFGGVKAPSAPADKAAGQEPAAGGGYRQLVEQASAGADRRKSAWAEVFAIGKDKSLPPSARVAALEKFLTDFPGDHPFRFEAEDMLARLKRGQERLLMVRIPEGELFMGCSPGDGECGDDEKPTHKVWVSEFWMDATEVPVASYGKCVQAGECSAPNTGGSCTWGVVGKEQHPINCVDWNQAKSFCAWAGKRLPTEAEWEKAARGETSGARYGKLDAIAWYKENSGGATQPVGKKQPNAFGLYDMLGNVWEWCSDWCDKGYYKESPGRDPKGPSSGQYRVLRGGSWSHVSRSERASVRGGNLPDDWNGVVGFRCAGSAAIGP